MGKLTCIDDLKPDAENARRHNPRNIEMIADSLGEVGAARSIVIDEDDVILAGNGVLRAAKAAGIENVRVVEADGQTIVAVRRSGLTTEQKKRLAYFDNRTAELADWSPEQVLADLDAGFDLSGLWDKNEIDELLAEIRAGDAPEDPGAQIDKAAELQEKWKVEQGQVWQCGKHFVICGDCREPETWERLLATARVDKVNNVFTSPPYAEQRKKQYGGVPVDEYVDWWEVVQANVKAHLAEDGSFFVNIKPHCEKGERVLYIFDLALAMKRRWEWRFVDELCWNKPGSPGVFGDRFRNDFEPVYHFARGKCRFLAENVLYKTSRMPIGSVGSNAAMQGIVGNNLYIRKDGMARPGNVIKTGFDSSGLLGHPAKFPVALSEFFVKAYSNIDDVWIDPFLGSGTTIVAAHQNNRRGMGIELLPKYVSVTLERLAGLGLEPRLATQ